MPMYVGGITLAQREGTPDPVAEFKELSEAYKFDGKIATYLVETLGLESLMDFAHAVTCESEWAPIMERIGELEKAAESTV